MRFQTPDNRFFEADNYTDLVNQLWHIMREPQPTMEDWMKMNVERVKDWQGATIRSDTPDHHIEDMLACDAIRKLNDSCMVFNCYGDRRPFFAQSYADLAHQLWRSQRFGQPDTIEQWMIEHAQRVYDCDGVVFRTDSTENHITDMLTHKYLELVSDSVK